LKALEGRRQPALSERGPVLEAIFESLSVSSANVAVDDGARPLNARHVRRGPRAVAGLRADQPADSAQKEQHDLEHQRLGLRRCAPPSSPPPGHEQGRCTCPPEGPRSRHGRPRTRRRAPRDRGGGTSAECPRLATGGVWRGARRSDAGFQGGPGQLRDRVAGAHHSPFPPPVRGRGSGYGPAQGMLPPVSHDARGRADAAMLRSGAADRPGRGRATRMRPAAARREFSRSAPSPLRWQRKFLAVEQPADHMRSHRAGRHNRLLAVAIADSSDDSADCDTWQTQRRPRTAARPVGTDSAASPREAETAKRAGASTPSRATEAFPTAEPRRARRPGDSARPRSTVIQRHVLSTPPGRRRVDRRQVARPDTAHRQDPTRPPHRAA